MKDFPALVFPICRVGSVGSRLPGIEMPLDSARGSANCGSEATCAPASGSARQHPPSLSTVFGCFQTTTVGYVASQPTETKIFTIRFLTENSWLILYEHLAHINSGTSCTFSFSLNNSLREALS